MSTDRELHDGSGVRVITGGLHDFVYSKKNLSDIESKDTESTKEFKKLLLMKRYLQNPNDLESKSKLMNYAKFHRLSINPKDKEGESVERYSLILEYEIEQDNYSMAICTTTLTEPFVMELPKHKYRITLTKKIFFFFKTSKVIEIELNKKTELTMTF